MGNKKKGVNNMRTVNRTISIEQTSFIEASIVTESILSISEDKDKKQIVIITDLIGADGVKIKDELYCISGSNYDLLMSANPTFAPNKPMNEYRENDLWYIIDLIKIR